MAALPERLARQSAVTRWTADTFGHDNAHHRGERVARFTEEALELAQAGGFTLEDLMLLAQHVFAKPPGTVSQEIGGVGVTLLSLAEAHGLDADACEAAEFERVRAIDTATFIVRHNKKAEAGVARWAGRR